MLSLSPLSEFLRFSLRAAPLFLFLVVFVDWISYQRSYDRLTAQHERDLAITIINAQATVDSVILTYPDIGEGNSLINDILKNYTKFPGVGCINLSTESYDITFPPKNFCSHLKIEKQESVELQTGGLLTFYRDDKYLNDLKADSLISLAYQTGLLLIAFAVFNFWSFKHVFEKHLNVVLKRNHHMFQRSPVAQVELSEDGEIHSSSIQWKKIFGDRLGANICDFVKEGEQKYLIQQIQDQITGGKDGDRQKFTFINSSGASFLGAIEVYVSEHGGDGRAFLAVHNVEDMRLSILEKEKEARIDVLTGVYTRRALEQDFRAFDKSAQSFIGLFDIDQFKSVNDLYGYDVGDAVIKKTAQYLAQHAPEGSSVYRLGGEEFVVIGYQSDGQVFDWKALAKGFALLTMESDLESFSRTVSGCIVYPEKCSSLGDNLKKCDQLVSQAKASGGNVIVYSDDKQFWQIDSHSSLSIKTALENGEFFFEFQPIFHSIDMRVLGAEALIRWRYQNTVLYPASFIKSYYKATLSIEDSTQRHLNFVQSLREFPFDPGVYVSYNITIEDIIANRDRALIEVLSPILNERKVVLELSEDEFGRRMSMSDMAEVLENIRSFGFLVALDDFGKRSSNFNRFIEMPIDIIKADLELVRGIDRDLKKQAVMTALRQVCDECDVMLIVEGVETVEEKRALDDLGVFAHQGFLYSKPKRGMGHEII